MNKKEVLENIRKELQKASELEVTEKIEFLNEVKQLLKTVSPFNDPVDIVQWIPSELVIANEYNPNRVAPPEMQLLKKALNRMATHSQLWRIKRMDTIRLWMASTVIVWVKNIKITQRIHGHLPIVVIDKPLEAAWPPQFGITAQEVHAIAPMSKVVEELYFWVGATKNCRTTWYGKG